jgi:hypothetical protein
MGILFTPSTSLSWRISCSHMVGTSPKLRSSSRPLVPPVSTCIVAPTTTTCRPPAALLSAHLWLLLRLHQSSCALTCFISSPFTNARRPPTAHPTLITPSVHSPQLTDPQLLTCVPPRHQELHARPDRPRPQRVPDGSAGLRGVDARLGQRCRPARPLPPFQPPRHAPTTITPITLCSSQGPQRTLPARLSALCIL